VYVCKRERRGSTGLSQREREKEREREREREARDHLFTTREMASYPNVSCRNVARAFIFSRLLVYLVIYDSG
jgi:hypothetical protein